MPLPKLPRGAYAEIAQGLGMSVTQVRNHLLHPDGAPARVQRAVSRALKAEEDRKRVAGFRRLITKGSPELVLHHLDQAERAAASQRVYDAFIEADLLGGAFDWFCGRQTGSAGDFALQLKQAWPDLASGTQHLLRRRLHQKFRRHAEQLRELVTFGGPGPSNGALGAKMDVGCWESLLRRVAKYDATAEGLKRLASFPGPPPLEPPVGFASQSAADAAYIELAYLHLQGRTSWAPEGFESYVAPPSAALQAALTGQPGPAASPDLAALVAITGPANPAIYTGKADKPSRASFAGKPGWADRATLAALADEHGKVSLADLASLTNMPDLADFAGKAGRPALPSLADPAGEPGPASGPN